MLIRSVPVHPALVRPVPPSTLHRIACCVLGCLCHPYLHNFMVFEGQQGDPDLHHPPESWATLSALVFSPPDPQFLSSLLLSPPPSPTSRTRGFPFPHGASPWSLPPGTMMHTAPTQPWSVPLARGYSARCLSVPTLRRAYGLVPDTPARLFACFLLFLFFWRLSKHVARRVALG